MVDIDLHAYIQDIEDMLTAEKNDEAVAHCRHILDHFPKNLAAYRLLGKGLLEKRQFSDANDILYRVLSAAPDDFVAHVGLAIIGEEQGDLEMAVGHMEQAFEAQSNNAAIHAELKRLYGRRDGVEPARIRLTKGALARVYIRGGSHGQAVDELRIAIQESPNRIDYQTLLAQALWKDEQRIDAVEVCQQILDKLPFCLQVNAILFEIWQSAGRDDEAEIYRQRVESLDPYLAQTIQQEAGINAAPDLRIPRLDYVPATPDESLGVPDWVHDLGLNFEDQPLPPLRSTGGVDPSLDEAARLPQTGPLTSPDTEEEPIPDWLRDVAADSEGDAGLAAGSGHWETDKQEQDARAVPDWLRDAALSEDENGKDEPVIIFEKASPFSERQQTMDGDHADDDMPDWLANAVEWSEENGDSSASEEPTQTGKEWTQSVNQTEASDPEMDELGEIPEWLESLQQDEGLESVENDQDQPAAAPLATDWNESGQSVTHPEDETGPVPVDLDGGDAFPFDWTSGEPQAQLEEEDEIGDQPATTQETQAPEIDYQEESVMGNSDDIFGVPAEMDDMGGMPSDPDDALAWLEKLAAGQGAPLDELPSLQGADDQETNAADDIPDWLKEIAPVDPFESEAAAVSESKSIPPADGFSADLDTDSEFSSDDLPDWLKPVEEEPSQPPPPIVSPKAAPSSDLPSWLQEELDTGEQDELDSELATLGVSQDDIPADPDEAMAWLERLAAGQGASLDELTSLDDDEMPDWLQEQPTPVPLEPDLPEATEPPSQLQAQSPEPIAEPTSETEMPEDVDEAMAWLERLAASEGAPIDELPTVVSSKAVDAVMPEWLEAETHPAETPEALPSEMDQKATEAAPSVEDELALPEWLQEQPSKEVATSSQDELPDWLREETVEPTAADKDLDLPEWLRGEPVQREEEPVAEEMDLPEWLRIEAPAAVDEPDQPDWLSDEAPAPQEEPAAVEEPDLPAWLREEAPAAEEEPAAVEEPDLPAWLRDEAPAAEEEPTPAMVEEPDLPAWLREEAPAAVEEPDLPAWLRDQAPAQLEEPAAAMVEEPKQVETWETLPEPSSVETGEPELVETVAAPMAPPEQILADTAELTARAREERDSEQIPEPLAEVEQVPAPAAEVEQVPAPVAEIEKVPAPVAEVTPAAEPPHQINSLAQVRDLVAAEKLSEALAGYTELITAGQDLEAIVSDLEAIAEAELEDSLSRRLLGDAYMKQGNLSQALNAYQQALQRL